MFTDLKVKVINSGKNRVILEDYTYENGKYIITVKAGFNTDGASIPKAFWSILSSPFDGAVTYGAVIHDGLYTKMQLPRKECDNLLREMALEKGYNKIKAFLVYYAVRMFGGSHWKKDTRAETHLITIKRKSNNEN